MKGAQHEDQATWTDGVEGQRSLPGHVTFGNQADQATSFAIMDVADRAGVTFFDAWFSLPRERDPQVARR